MAKDVDRARAEAFFEHDGEALMGFYEAWDLAEATAASSSATGLPRQEPATSSARPAKRRKALSSGSKAKQPDKANEENTTTKDVVFEVAIEKPDSATEESESEKKKQKRWSRRKYDLLRQAVKEEPANDDFEILQTLLLDEPDVSMAEAVPGDMRPMADTSQAKEATEASPKPEAAETGKKKEVAETSQSKATAEASQAEESKPDSTIDENKDLTADLTAAALRVLFEQPAQPSPIPPGVVVKAQSKMPPPWQAATVPSPVIGPCGATGKAAPTALAPPPPPPPPPSKATLEAVPPQGEVATPPPLPKFLEREVLPHPPPPKVRGFAGTAHEGRFYATWLIWKLFRCYFHKKQIQQIISTRITFKIYI